MNSLAERRMFTRKVTDDDNFMNLSSSAQALYLHLSMSADDDGFCNQVSVAMFKAHASVQDLQALLEKRYIYQFDNGVIVIKHWRMANALRKDRYTPTAFQEELAKLKLKDNGSYTMATEWQPSGNQCLPQDSIGKNMLGKDSIEREDSQARPTRHKYGKFNNVLLSDDELEKLKEKFPNDYEMRINDLSYYIDSKGNKYKRHYSTILNWDRMDKEKEAEKRKSLGESSFDLDEFQKAALARS